MQRYYESSGKFDVAGLFLLLGIGAVGGLVMGAIYGAVSFWNPLVYVNFLGALVVGGITGFCAGQGARLGRVRNAGLGLVLGLVAGLAAQYANVVTWIWALSGREALLLAPGAVIDAMRAVNAIGPWSIGGWTASGVALWAIWAVEAAIIIGGAGLLTMSQTAQPFCESCRAWVGEARSAGPFTQVADTAGLKTDLEAGSFERLAALDGVSEGPGRHTEIELRECPTCDALNLLTVQDVTVTRSDDKDGKDKVEKTPIVENLVMSQEVYDQVSLLTAKLRTKAAGQAEASAAAGA